MDKDFLPNLSITGITVGWSIRRLAAFLLLVAAPDLLCWRPSTAPIAVGGPTIEGCFTRALLTTAGRLNRACAANVAFHLYFAVGQVTGITLGSEDMLLCPSHS